VLIPPHLVHYPYVGDIQQRDAPPQGTTLYELEALFAEEGWPSEEFVYDKEHDLYRFADGEFAFSG
jgi:hypothetical protein